MTFFKLIFSKWPPPHMQPSKARHIHIRWEKKRDLSMKITSRTWRFETCRYLKLPNFKLTHFMRTCHIYVCLWDVCVHTQWNLYQQPPLWVTTPIKSNCLHPKHLKKHVSSCAVQSGILVTRFYLCLDFPTAEMHLCFLVKGVTKQTFKDTPWVQPYEQECDF